MDMPQELQQDAQRNILARLGKIEGQIRGLQGMVRDGKECEQILTQLRAAQAALKAVTPLVLKGYLMKCHDELGPHPTAEQVSYKLEKVVTLLARFMGE
jgi:DNA-binding FrmR family transcriptional regulator